MKYAFLRHTNLQNGCRFVHGSAGRTAEAPASPFLSHRVIFQNGYGSIPIDTVY